MGDPVYFLGVTPPAGLADRILAWQRALEHVVTAPHVTVRGPEVRPQRFAACEAACRQFQPFSMRLEGVDSFTGRAIFLRAGGEGLSGLHRALVAAAADAPGPFELGGYHPHLSLALSWRPMNRSWAAALDSARSAFGDVAQDAAVRSVTLFCKERAGEPYHAQAEWPLGG